MGTNLYLMLAEFPPPPSLDTTYEFSQYQGPEFEAPRELGEHSPQTITRLKKYSRFHSGNAS